MTSTEVLPKELPKSEGSPAPKKELTKEEKEKQERSLRPYWYPSEVGEQNPELPKILSNVTRYSPLTTLIDLIVKITIALLLCGLGYLALHQLYSVYNPQYPLFSQENNTFLYAAAGAIFLVFAVTVWYFSARDPDIFLVGFATATPPKEYRVTQKEFAQYTHDIKVFNPESLAFLERMIPRTGLGDETALPHAFKSIPPDDSYKEGRDELEVSIRLACDELFKANKIDPTKDIDFIVSNCSMFAPTPSLAAMIMNIYKVKTTCKNYSLGGMGCSAGLISLDLARDILRCYKNVNVLVYSTENITRGWYGGQVRGKLLSDTLFRMGGAAILLSNKPKYRFSAPYKLMTTVRISHCKFDDAYHSIFQDEDDQGIVGTKIGRELFKCVSRALLSNLNVLMPQVMSWRDILRYAYDLLLHKIGKRGKQDMFKPNFRETFQGFCIHAGGRAIIDGLQENMELTDEDCYPSRAALYRFGNTSSSSVWYEFKFMERVQTLKKGDTVLQIGFGSGLKCNSVVWKKIN
ncbi:hypothetical protein EIN_026020 [Entamoeba invadens IP1]|uniref:hypothetical protein n=1 Tax=Entamoeba invadens IP1 TaxID=370355 RepID=UPI0002C3E6BF|nr:hypothetical protein EIN_026020 [Entamoeba invadens IP1]ELP90763.1 hypothetical protein EIN_026020 [Entamoeba invadens IP1]|eukprot:XP_004257534.1 hypothetical protein EIN_026020 [Entamoeba invadens IP1]